MNKIIIGLSGGINSMAVLCYVIEHFTEEQLKNLELHLFYAHFEEHSPDTYKFVKAGIRYAKEKVDNVFVKITRNSVLDYFEEQKNNTTSYG